MSGPGDSLATSFATALIERPIGMPLFTIWAPAQSVRHTIEGPNQVGGAVLAIVEDTFDIPHTGWVAATLENIAGSSVAVPVNVQVEVAVEGVDGPARLRFDDGSEVTYGLPKQGESTAEPLDTGLALLEPITERELAAIETVLSGLEREVEAGNLTPLQEQRVLAMADLIRTTQIEATPNETERWKLVGPVRAALRYVTRQLPRDGLAWYGFARVLDDINWSTLAEELSHLA